MSAPAVLVLDDDHGFRRLLATVLEREGYPTALASNGAEARTLLAGRSFALVVCDLQLPGESGDAVVRHVSAQLPGTAVLVVSGGADRDVAEQLLADGAYGYLIKPFGLDQFLITVANALRRRELEQDRLLYERTLEHAVTVRTAELLRSRRETVRRLAAAVDSRDNMTGHHSERTARYALTIARRLGLPAEECDLIALATPLHDIGKIAIPDRILHKPESLTATERRTMQTHAAVGHRMLAGSGEDLLELAATIAWTHHERLDGSGYPRGLRGDAIPAVGRITAVADTMDALTSDRPYRRAYSLQEAAEILGSLRGRELEAEMVDAVLDSLAGGADLLADGTPSSSLACA
jgi:putative two-component system response regulator